MLFCLRTVHPQESRSIYRSRNRAFAPLLCCIFCLVASSMAAFGAELQECQKLYLSGQYADCIRLSNETMKDRYVSEDWSILLTKSLLMVGHYGEALTVVSNAVSRHSGSLPVRVLAHEVFLQNGQTEQAKSLLEEINQLGSRSGAYRNSASLVALGNAALLLGADPRLVLENFFNPIKKSEPTFRDVYLAIGELALNKNDDALAAQTFQDAIKRFPKDPEMLYGLAKAYGSSDRPKMVEYLQAALEQNSKHVASMLLMADHMIDAEEYQRAGKSLDQALAVNPSHPEAWAYRAVLAHLNSDAKQEKTARASALQFWKTNPRVEFLIGQKLSQKYRFTEGSSHQRQAVKWDQDYLPSKIQLAQDLLRLGEDDEGWKLAEEVHKKDGYDVAAYNLVTLGESLSRFQMLSNQDFRVRMHPHEVAVYGDRAMALLQRAKDVLCRKYGFEPEKRTTVEIFPEQKDFAVRTFGMPGGAGYLGVCFGCVITANSPASRAANPSSWEAVLWHEYCHVVTLGLTKNKMPRWLSEGISVYEERQAKPVWGENMTPRYRQMILKGELTPIGELSGAFLTPKTGLHLQFAYYESSMVVEFLIQRFGLDSIKRILHDLGEGKAINNAIETHTEPLEKLEKEFTTFIRERAEQLGQGLDWKEQKTELRPRLAAIQPELNPTSQNPTNYWVLIERAKKLLDERKWQEAKEPLQTILDHYPDSTGADSGYALIAAAHRSLSETELERAALEKFALLDADATDAFLRLMEMASAKGEWNKVAVNGERYLSVNPLVPQPYRYLGRAHEELGNPREAIQAYRTLLKLDPADVADVHFRLAKLLHQAGDAAAKRHALQALEEAPRFREAHQLLLNIVEKPGSEAPRSPDNLRPSKEAAQP
ncbi:MAG: tetratricopeptide repeat protein [Pedosphaera sp.]|nr:tetratricopeptide repeat protein [Pedosphaera sp.]